MRGLQLVVAVVAVTGLCVAGSVRADVVTASLEVEAMGVPATAVVLDEAGASGGRVVRLTTGDPVVGGVTLGVRTSSFVVRARGAQCRGNWPRLTVHVDGTRVLNQLVSATAPTDVPIAVSLPAGGHEVRLALTNASANATCARTLWLDVVTFLAPGPPPPTLTLSASSTDVAHGEAVVLTWTSAGADACTAGGGWSGPQPPSGSASSGPLTADTTFALTCSGPGGAVTRSVAVTVQAPAPPVVSLTAVPATIVVGSSAELRWSSTGADTCEAGDAWSGAQDLAGTASTGPLTAEGTVTYSLTCTGPGGATSASASVVVTPPAAPLVVLTAMPLTVTEGGEATLSWSATGADACVASGAWSGDRPTAGSEGTGVLAVEGPHAFTLTCTGPGGLGAATVEVLVGPPPAPATPTVSLSATPAVVVTDGQVDLVWTSTDADTCEATGAWSGQRPSAGAEQATMPSEPGAVTFVLACTGPGGTTEAAATVEVVAPPPPGVDLTVQPATVAVGGSVTVSWSSTGAAGCVAGGAWSGERPVGGSETVGPFDVPGALDVSLTCTGPGGSTTAVVPVTVTPPAPTIAIVASESVVPHGGSTTLTWTSTDADACTAGGDWSGSRPTQGAAETGPLSRTATFLLACTGPGGTASSGVSVTVTPPAPGCTTADTSGCVPGSEVVVTDAGWTCSRALASYGALPVKVTVLATTAYTSSSVTLTTGCSGDGDPATIDLILDVRGDGRTVGTTDDAVKTKLQAGYVAGIQITGHVDCGPRSPTAHQDGVQAQGGRDITFADFSVGDWSNGVATCQGAGGAFFFSGAGGYAALSTHVLRGSYVACSKGLAVASTSNTGSVVGASFRSGRTDGTDPTCTGLAAPRVCATTSLVPSTGIVCERWSSLSAQWMPAP